MFLSHIHLLAVNGGMHLDQCQVYVYSHAYFPCDDTTPSSLVNVYVDVSSLWENWRYEISQNIIRLHVNITFSQKNMYVTIISRLINATATSRYVYVWTDFIWEYSIPFHWSCMHIPPWFINLFRSFAHHYWISLAVRTHPYIRQTNGIVVKVGQVYLLLRLFSFLPWLLVSFFFLPASNSEKMIVVFTKSGLAAGKGSEKRFTS